MIIKHIIKKIISWTIGYIFVGAVIGIITAQGDTGHVGPLGNLIVLLTIAAIIGVTYGLTFALYLELIAPRLQAKLVRISVSTALGVIAGVLGLYFADKGAGIRNWLIAGSITGAITGLACGIYSVANRVTSQNRISSITTLPQTAIKLFKCISFLIITYVMSWIISCIFLVEYRLEYYFPSLYSVLPNLREGSTLINLFALLGAAAVISVIYIIKYIRRISASRK